MSFVEINFVREFRQGLTRVKKDLQASRRRLQDQLVAAAKKRMVEEVLDVLTAGAAKLDACLSRTELRESVLPFITGSARNVARSMFLEEGQETLVSVGDDSAKNKLKEQLLLYQKIIDSAQFDRNVELAYDQIQNPLLKAAVFGVITLAGRFPYLLKIVKETNSAYLAGIKFPLQIVTSFVVNAPAVDEKIGYALKPMVEIPPRPIAQEAPSLPSLADYPGQIIDAATEAGRKELEKPWDVIIVGSGVGGGAFGRTFLEEMRGRGLRVLVVEEGGIVGSQQLREKPLVTTMQELFRQGAVQSAFGFGPAGLTTVAVMTGRVLGGTAFLNSGTVREPEETIWQRIAGNDPVILAKLKLMSLLWKLEHGVIQAPAETINPIQLAFLDTAKNMGLVGDRLYGNRGIPGGCERGSCAEIEEIKRLLEQSINTCVGLGSCPAGCPMGAKKSPDQTDLPVILKEGGYLAPQLRAQRFIVDEDLVTDLIVVNAAREEIKLPLTANGRRGTLVLGGGAIEDPLLLFRSLPRNITREWGVGEGLTGHFALEGSALFHDPCYAFQGLPQAIGVHDPNDPRWLIEAAFPPPAALAITLLGVHGQALLETLEKITRISVMGGVVTQGKSRGRILPSGQIWNSVLPEDMLAAKALLAAILKIYAQMPGVEALKGPTFPLFTGTKDGFFPPNRLGEYLEDLKDWTKNPLLTEFHPMATLVLATNNVAAGTLMGIRNLRCVSAAALDGPLGANPMLALGAQAKARAENLVEQYAA